MQKSKYFIITIDTEGDNQWDENSKISTKNSLFLPRFQELAEKYSYKPVWLTNYEMVCDDSFVKYMKEKQKNNLCEIGMHLHAWNSPPNVSLNRINKEKDYLIEYDDDIMYEKIKFLTDLLTEKFGIKPVSHRSGRWATNDKYFDIINQMGYLIDCSVTPHINWKNKLGSTGMPGSDYSNIQETPYFISKQLVEVPMTIKAIHNFQFDRVRNIKNFLGECKRFVFGRYQWMRPDNNLNKSGLKKLIDICSKNDDYIMFMIHSSELMPGGSPNFKNEDEVEKLYDIIDYVFSYAYKKGFIGITLRDFYAKIKESEE